MSTGATADRATPARANQHVLPESMIFTDEWPPYESIGSRFKSHRRIRHKEAIYVDGDSHPHTVEGFFGLFKNGVRGVYHAVAAKWLESYLNDAWRYNRRRDKQPMFYALALRAAH
ncbi:MAG: transposase [Actinomycetota bacterium]|nr:transposase [Actinomycetota bacterium]